MARTNGGRGGEWLRDNKQSASHALDKAPQFRASMDRFGERVAERLSTTFGALFSAAVEEARNSKAFAALEAHAGQPAVALASPALDARMAFLFEAGSADLIISTMFGFEAANDAAPAAAPKAPTALEMRMIGELAGALAEALCAAFAPVADFDLAFEKAETVEDDSLLGAKDMPALLAPIAVRAPAGGFTVTLLIPYPFLDALALALARGPAPGAAKLDPVWSSRMEKRVTEASLRLTAVLDEFQMSLADVSTLRVGHVLPLSDGGQALVRIDCGERGVAVCSLGERSGRYALQVEDIIAKPVEGAYPGASN
jgi:flagellar motor switch protein FliM